MKNFFSLLALLPFFATAQNTIDVEAGGSTEPGSTEEPYFDPANIAIQVGDAVHWYGPVGIHNVYGEWNLFPSNPVGFSSGAPTAFLDYFFTFTTPGYYEYMCQEPGHQQTQFGTILVLGTQSVEEQNDFAGLKLFPQPAGNELRIELTGNSLMRAEVIGVDGRTLRTQALGNVERAVINTSELAHGRYLLRLSDAKGHAFVRPFIKGL